MAKSISICVTILTRGYLTSRIYLRSMHHDRYVEEPQNSFHNSTRSTMADYKPYSSCSRFIAALDDCHSPKAARCHLCHAELNSATPLDPLYLCEGPAIQLACCNLLLGKHCLLQYMEQRTDPKCILCLKLWYNNTSIKPPRRIWRTRWKNFVVGTSCILYTIILANYVASIDDRNPISVYQIWRILWYTLRPGLEVILLFALCAPIDEDLQRRLLRGEEGFVFMVVEMYIELPPIFSVPLMVVLQVFILYHMWQMGCEV